MHLLFDGNALQSQANNSNIGLQQSGERLSGVIEALDEELSYGVEFTSEGDEISEEDLEPADVLVIPTRPPAGAGPYEQPFSYSEIQRIVDFVEDGHGLVVLTNHENFTAEDTRLTEEFGIEILDHSIHFDADNPVEMGPDHLYDHPIIEGGPDGRTVSSLKVDNCSKLLREEDEVQEVVDLGDMADAYFCLATEADAGRVVAVADSGILGTEKSQIPGPGMFSEADNRAFILNAFQWAASDLDG
jgi:hypothetical protein